MASDCFGNPTDFPPSICDTFHDIQTYGVVPWEVRDEYHRARTAAMIGRGSREHAWGLFRRLNLMVLQANRQEVSR